MATTLLAMSRPPQVLVRLSGAAVFLLLAAFGGRLSPVVLIMLVAATLLAMVVVDIRGRMVNPVEMDAEHTPTSNHGLVDAVAP